MARMITSVGSCRSLPCLSSAMTSVFIDKLDDRSQSACPVVSHRHQPRRRAVSSCSLDFTVTSFRFQSTARIMDKDIVKRFAAVPVEGCLASSAGVPITATLPRCIIATRLHRLSASSIRCVVRTMVVP